MSEDITKQAINIKSEEEDEAVLRELMNVIEMTTHIIGSLIDPNRGDIQPIQSEARRMAATANRASCRIHTLSTLEWAGHMMMPKVEK